jgi:putative transposase
MNSYGRRAPVRPPHIAARNNRKPQWVVDEVIRLKAFLPRAGSITLAATFNRLHGATRKTTVSRSYVVYTVRANLLAIAPLRRDAKHAVPRGVARNTEWGIDMTGNTNAAGKLHSIFAVIDHGTRHVVSLRALANKSSWILLGHLCMAIGRYGKPTAIRSNNERAFTSRVFRSALLCLGIRHQRIDLGCPWMNGRIVRYFGTLEISLNHWTVDDGGQLQASLDVFRD